MTPQLREFNAIMECRKWAIQRDNIVTNESRERDFREAVFRMCQKHSDSVATKNAKSYEDDAQQMLLKKLSMNL